MRVVLVTGGFDPIHSGHIAYFKAAAELGDQLVVGINSDSWLSRKKGKPFMSSTERKSIIEHLSMVDQVIEFNDNANHSCDAINKVRELYPNDTIVFANGGDRTNTTTPEYSQYGTHPAVEFVFGVGGTNKANSSSWLLESWRADKTDRPWGYWRVLDDKAYAGVKVKELVINPHNALSDQRHKYRSEHWYILEGSMTMKLEALDGCRNIVNLNQHDSLIIPVGYWHKAIGSNVRCHILEVQYGTACEESDIERRDTDD